MSITAARSWILINILSPLEVVFEYDEYASAMKAFMIVIFLDLCYEFDV